MVIASPMVTCCHVTPPSAGGGGGSASTAAARLRRACVAAAAAAAVLGTAAGGDGAAMATPPTREVATATARWSDRRQCPPWRANSLENIVPENLPRPSAQRRFNNITAAAAENAPAPASSASAASPDAVVPFLALRSGMGCFSL